MKTIFKRFLSTLSLATPFFCGVLFFVNLVVSFFAYRSARPQFMYKFFVVTNYVSSVVTQSFNTALLASGSSESSVSSSSLPNIPPVYSCSYDYIVLGGVPCIRFAGKVYYQGDFCSRGCILRIFPDRVFLMDGSVLENTRFTSKQIEERIKPYDRKSIL